MRLCDTGVHMRVQGGAGGHVFEHPAVALPHVAPVVLGDELGLGAGREVSRGARHRRLEAEARSTMTPAVRRAPAPGGVERYLVR